MECCLCISLFFMYLGYEANYFSVGEVCAGVDSPRNISVSLSITQILPFTWKIMLAVKGLAVLVRQSPGVNARLLGITWWYPPSDSRTNYISHRWRWYYLSSEPPICFNLGSNLCHLSLTAALSTYQVLPYRLHDKSWNVNWRGVTETGPTPGLLDAAMFV